jgi:UDP-N-acetylglucosamine--N-acetylmuramyl-(pentapeptide) pyrophosphoryl-undecaprenol N-acetylglucosamine transferase
LFIGTADGFEARILPGSGYPFYTVSAAPWLGVGAAGRARTVPGLCMGIVQARRLLIAHGVQMVIGLGGYVSVGALLAGWSLGLRTALHEANVELGVANTVLMRVVDRAYLGFAATGAGLPQAKTLVTGTPVRPDVAAAALPRLPPDATRAIRILVTGGSQGSRFFNENVPDVLQRLAAHGFQLDVRHQTGDLAAEPVRQRYAGAQIPARVVSYIDDMATAYGWADFAIARSGAATIAELAVSGLPALLVPLPTAARDHQTRNAVAFAQAGGGWWVRESAWGAEQLAQRIAGLLRDAPAWQAASQAARRLARPDAARVLAADCAALMNGCGREGNESLRS